MKAAAIVLINVSAAVGVGLLLATIAYCVAFAWWMNRS